MRDRKILILGGTGEAAEIARRLSATGNRVVTSLAGRTANPATVSGEVRTGGFGGVDGLTKYLRDETIDILVDATHPFAAQISRNARTAAENSGTRHVAFVRPKWTSQAGDRWQTVDTIEAAVAALPADAHVLLALGSQHIAAFAARTDCRFLVRMIDEPAKPLPLAAYHLLIGRPSRDPAGEETLLRENAISHIVCRNSGGSGAQAKLDAARRLGLPVVMIGRPPLPDGPVFTSLDALIVAIG